MIGYAAKYGNQQLSEIGDMTSSELREFNDGVYFWIEKENDTNKDR